MKHAILGTMLFTTCMAAAQPRQELVAGTTRVVVEPWNRGVSVVVDGVTVSRGSNMVVTTPPWTPHYYLGPSATAVESATQGMVEGGTFLRMRHRGQQDAFVGDDTITVTPGRVERVLEGQFTRDEGEALIQWQIAGLDPALIIGRRWRATWPDGRVAEGTVPVVAESGEVERVTLAKGFSALEFDSRLGLIRIRVDSNQPLICYDYRKSRWADPGRPLFWLGDLGTRFRKGDTLRYRVVFEFAGPAARASTASPIVAAATVERHENAQTFPQETPPTIIPRPKEATWGSGGYYVRSTDEIRIDEGVQAGGADRELISYLTGECGLAPAGREARKPESPQSQGIVFGKSAELLPPEGYRLRISPDGVRIEAADEAGYRYAVRTLRQLVTRTRAGEVMFPAAQIRDWPSLSFRGVHLFTGGQGPELHLRLIRDVIAALKMNHIVLESEYIKWDSHPEIHHAEYGMSKEDVRKILAACRELGVEVIPLVMSLGHCQWMFHNDQNLDLAEDPEAKWTYCVTNPRTYEFIYQIYQEAVELFQPKYFHIGHDEFTHRGRVPFREETRKLTVEEILLLDTKRHHEWFKARGIRVMMWGDMLLAPDEAPDAGHAANREAAARQRAELPKDILIADWHYVDTDPANYTSLKTFHDAGFQTVAAGWSRPGNIVHLAQAAYAAKSLGYLQTTWAGYSLDPGRFEKEIRQYAMYVLAAEAAWNADNPPDPESFPASAYFFDLMKLSPLKPENRTGWVADLRAAYNCPLAATDAEGWFQLGPQHDLSAIPRGLVTFKGIRFRLQDADKPLAPAAVGVRGKLSPDLPEAAEITLDAPAARLVFLHTTNFPCDPGAKVGTYEVRYADGQTVPVDVVYGRNVLAYTDLTPSPQAPLVWSGRTAAGAPVALRVLLWDNPHPDVAIHTLTVRSGDAAGALMLLAVTGLDQPQNPVAAEK
jgi:hexosaminidase